MNININNITNESTKRLSVATVCMFTSKVLNSICCLVLESFCAAGLLKSYRWKQLPLAVGIVFNGNYENKSKSQSCEQIKTQNKQAKIWQTYLC